MPSIINQVLLDQYRIDAFLASGGMGAVYRVWDLKRNVPLAMKVLHADLAEDPYMFKRFEREANALKKLSHPNIVPFYGLFRSGQLVFLLERYIDGPSLKEILQNRDGRLVPIQEALIYFKSITSALGYAHAKGVVHCDVKPGNILLDRGGNIYLADFGIARHADSTATSMPGAGTAAYMAPEQILDSPLTPATDVYALAVMLFEMLTGQRPFRGNEAGTEGSGQAANERIRAAHLQLPPPDPRSINPSIPAALANVILKSLDKRPDHRYRTATDFFAAFCDALDISHDSISDRGPQGVGVGTDGSSSGVGETNRAQTLIRLVAGITLTSFVAIVVATFFFMRPPPLTPTPELPLTAITKLANTSTQPPPTTSFTATSSQIPSSTSVPAIVVVKGAEMVLIPAGGFTMGNTVDQAVAECENLFVGSANENCKDEYFADEAPPHEVNLDSYYIDKYEVTNALYKACVDTGECTAPVKTSSETHPAYYGGAEYEDYPVIWITRGMAQTYCEWRGGRLPTEAEWEIAARGASNSNYPWSNTFDGSKANSCDINCRAEHANKNVDDGYADVAPVHAFADGASVYGVFNLSGNVSEWVSDWYSDIYYASSSVFTNPSGPVNGSSYVFRGGSWRRFPINLRITTRSKQTSDYSANDLGFRCTMPLR